MAVIARFYPLLDPPYVLESNRIREPKLTFNFQRGGVYSKYANAGVVSALKWTET